MPPRAGSPIGERVRKRRRGLPEDDIADSPLPDEAPGASESTGTPPSTPPHGHVDLSPAPTTPSTTTEGSALPTPQDSPAGWPVVVGSRTLQDGLLSATNMARIMLEGTKHDTRDTAATQELTLSTDSGARDLDAPIVPQPASALVGPEAVARADLPTPAHPTLPAVNALPPSTPATSATPTPGDVAQAVHAVLPLTPAPATPALGTAVDTNAAQLPRAAPAPVLTPPVLPAPVVVDTQQIVPTLAAAVATPAPSAATSAEATQVLAAPVAAAPAAAPAPVATDGHATATPPIAIGHDALAHAAVVPAVAVQPVHATPTPPVAVGGQTLALAAQPVDQQVAQPQALALAAPQLLQTQAPVPPPLAAAFAGQPQQPAPLPNNAQPLPLPAPVVPIAAAPVPHILQGFEDVPPAIHALAMQVATTSLPDQHTYSVTRLPARLDWGRGRMERRLCEIPSTPVYMRFTGRVRTSWFFDRSGTPQSRVNVGVHLLLNTDEQAIENLYSKAQPPIPVPETIFASRLQGQRQRGSFTETVLPFKNVFDARDGVLAKTDDRRINAVDFTDNDVIAVDAEFTRWKKPRATNWTEFGVGFELAAIYLLWDST
ncbi:hypothetical protein C8T65DRAFT_747417 [Cerioporus squamosus]|nr:hypothetical protein C8T65DRAFT_747417 [Cerioporus squamosus]